MGRAPCCSKVGMRKGAWTAEEDMLLTNYIQLNGEGNWRSLPMNAGNTSIKTQLSYFNKFSLDNHRYNVFNFIILVLMFNKFFDIQAFLDVVRVAD